MTAHDQNDIFGTSLPAQDNYPPPDLGLTIAIVVLSRRWRSLIDEKMREIGQSASRMEALAAIAYSPAGTTQIQIAKRIGIEGPTLTRTLDMLEADGLVERLADPNDRRNKHMKLTPAGFDALVECFAIAGRFRDRLLADLPRTEIKRSLDLLRQLITRIDSGQLLAGED